MSTDQASIQQRWTHFIKETFEQYKPYIQANPSLAERDDPHCQHFLGFFRTLGLNQGVRNPEIAIEAATQRFYGFVPDWNAFFASVDEEILRQLQTNPDVPPERYVGHFIKIASWLEVMMEVFFLAIENEDGPSGDRIMETMMDPGFKVVRPFSDPKRILDLRLREEPLVQDYFRQRG